MHLNLKHTIHLVTGDGPNGGLNEIYTQNFADSVADFSLPVSEGTFVLLWNKAKNLLKPENLTIGTWTTSDWKGTNNHTLGKCFITC